MTNSLPTLGRNISTYKTFLFGTIISDYLLMLVVSNQTIQSVVYSHGAPKLYVNGQKVQGNFTKFYQLVYYK